MGASDSAGDSGAARDGSTCWAAAHSLPHFTPVMHRLLALALLCSPAAAQIVEDFEHGNEALYLPMNAGIDTLDIVASAAHDGNFGAQYGTSGGPAWRGRLDV
jgi:hypothetical protein